MYAGFMLIGDGTLEANPFNFEIINSARAYAYACNVGMTWLSDCDICESTGTVLPGGPEYSNPKDDLAPWYDPDDPDTEKFLGVMGLEVIGAEDSTRTATVTAAATGGGVISALSFKPRTMTVRVLAMAEDECGMQIGLNWLRLQYAANQNNCTGDVMTFFDCCPCVCVNEGLGQICWIDHYREIPGDPENCEVDWWPSTYAELRDGPDPDETEDWCSWLKNYRQLANEGPPGYACCTEQCVVPYLRQFHNVRIIAGPTVLKMQPMNSKGWIAQLEFIVVAADPAEYGMPDAITLMTMGGEFLDDSPPMARAMAFAEPEPEVDPFAIPGWTEPRTAYIAPPVTPIEPLPTEWSRSTYDVTLRSRVATLNTMVAWIELTALADTGRVRLGLWHDEELVQGIYIPALPAGAHLIIDRGRARVVNGDGTLRTVSGFVRSYDGAPASWDATMAPGTFALSVDRDPSDDSQLRVEVLAAAKGSG
jgi:hypothetical protein